MALKLLSGLDSSRRLSAASGVVMLLILGALLEGSVADGLALIAWAMLAFAAASGWLQLRFQRGLPQEVIAQVENQNSRAWVVVTITVIVAAGISAQTWFRPG